MYGCRGSRGECDKGSKYYWIKKQIEHFHKNHAICSVVTFVEIKKIVYLKVFWISGGSID